MVLGMSIPFLLMNHLFVTRISLAVFATEKGYAQELYSFWVGAPLLGMLQVSVLIVAWIHGCIGMYQWLRLKPMFGRWMPFLFCAAVMLPVLALLGFFRGGWTMLHLAQDPTWRAANLNPGQIGTPSQNRQLLLWRNWSLGAAAVMLIFVLLARLARAWRERRGAGIRVTYPNGRGVRVPARLQRAGGEQERADSACEHLRWAWTVLDLSYPGLCWIGLNSRTGGGRGSRASTGWRRSGRAARLPIATQGRRQRGAHPAAQLAARGPTSPGMADARRGTVHRGVDGRYAELDPAC